MLAAGAIRSDRPIGWLVWIDACVAWTRYDAARPGQHRPATTRALWRRPRVATGKAQARRTHA